MEPTNDRYFRRRIVTGSSTFEESYWGVIVDPDGKTRDRRKERDQFLQDTCAEINHIGALDSGRILDVGCGLGFLLSALDETWEKHGVEVSEFAAKAACRWGKIHWGTLHDAGYPDEFFDIVVMHHVIEHLEDPLRAVEEVRRVLHRGGRFILATPDFDSGCARRFGEKYRLLHDPTHISLFDADSTHRLLRDHGFVIDHVDFPFFETRHFTRENLSRLFDTDAMSPPFYGNFMTFYSHKPRNPHTISALMRLGFCGKRELSLTESVVNRLFSETFRQIAIRGRVFLASDQPDPSFCALLRTIMKRAVGFVEVTHRPEAAHRDDSESPTIWVCAEHGPPTDSVRPWDVIVLPENHEDAMQYRDRCIGIPVPPNSGWLPPTVTVIDGIARDLALVPQDPIKEKPTKGKKP